MIYFSQLDLVHILERALRRSGLPLYYTQGFNPRTKISFSNGLKLGVEGVVGVTFYFTQAIGFSHLRDALKPQLPQGLNILPDTTQNK
ncbi:MAG: DUF2344 domain-containing protein [Candidatus Omnitrophota bacterium]|nr:MAG: DUF2344 domain-containing protein [Candidatus Omnitrophota bacterium]